MKTTQQRMSTMRETWRWWTFANLILPPLSAQNTKISRCQGWQPLILNSKYAPESARSKAVSANQPAVMRQRSRKQAKSSNYARKRAKKSKSTRDSGLSCSMSNSRWLWMTCGGREPSDRDQSKIRDQHGDDQVERKETTHTHLI